jgi:putative oxidoreductase
VEHLRTYTRAQDAALLAMRLVVAAVFMYAGTAKWPLWSAPLEGMSATLLNIVRFLAIVEPLGSVALVFGVLTRWAAAGLGIIMVGAIYYARTSLHAGVFTGPQGTGLDYNLLLLAGCIVLVAFGAGGWSVDATRKR